MEDKKIKKKKLTLTVSTKKTFNTSNFLPGSHKKSVVIEQKVPRKRNEQRYYPTRISLNIQLRR